MEEVKKQLDFVLDGFFFYFGLIDNPTDKPAKEVIKKTPSQKIRADLKRVNSSYRKEYKRLRNEILQVEE